MGALPWVLAIPDGWLAAERLVPIAPASGIPDLPAGPRTELGLGERTTRRLLDRVRLRTGYDVGELLLMARGPGCSRRPVWGT